MQELRIFLVDDRNYLPGDDRMQIACAGVAVKLAKNATLIQTQ